MWIPLAVWAGLVSSDAWNDMPSESSPSSGCGPLRKCSSLEPGQWLAPGEWLTSPSENYIAVLCLDQLSVREAGSWRTISSSPPLGSLRRNDALAAAHTTEGQLLLETTGGQTWPTDVRKHEAVFLKFTVTGTRGGGDARIFQGVQISEFVLWAKGRRLELNGAKAYSSSGSPHYQGPENTIDGTVRTKWWTSDEPNVTLVLELTDAPPEGQMHFSFATGDDMPSRDPVTWLLEGSRDGQTWESLHRQDAVYRTPLTRFSNTPQGWPAFDISSTWRRLMRRTSQGDECTRSPSMVSLTDLGSLRIVPSMADEQLPVVPRKTRPALEWFVSAAIC